MHIIAHGQAVAVGMCFAAYVSHHMYNLSEKDMLKIFKVLIDSGCLPSKEDLETYLVVDNLMDRTLWLELLGYMEHDKKLNHVTHRHLPFVLLKKIGKVERSDDGGYTLNVLKSELGPLWKEFIKDIYY